MQARYFASLTAWILRLRWPLLALCVVLTTLLARGLPGLRLDNSNESWLVQGDDSLRLIRKFNDLFGNDDFVYLLYETQDFFQKAPIRRLGALARDLEERVPHVIDTTWLGNAERIEGHEESIDVEELMDPLPSTRTELERVRSLALSEPSYVDNLISANGTTAAILLEMDAYPEDKPDPRKDVAPAVRKVMSEPEHAGLGIIAVGGPLLDYDLDAITASEGRNLGLLCLAVQVAILMWVGRGPRGALVPAVVVVASVLWTFGLVALAGVTLNASVIMVPVLLICVGICDSMHVISEFLDQRSRGFANRDALTRAMSLVGWPCVLTSLTTAAGFLSFLTTPIQPFRAMGLYAAGGVLVALLLTFMLVPILYSWGGDAGQPEPGAFPLRRDGFDRLLRATSHLLVAHPGALLGCFAALTAVATVGWLRVEYETNPLEMFRPGVPIRVASETVDAKMGGSMSVEIMLDTGREDGVLDPDFLSKMDALDHYAREHELTTRTTSVLDIFRQMRRAFHENRAEYYDIPRSREEAAQYLLLYEASGGEDKNKLVSFQNDVARLTARTPSLGTKDVGHLFADLEAFADDTFDGEAQLELTGTLRWVDAMTEHLARGQRSSFLAAFSVITVLMMLVLRSVRLGLISMIPNLFPVLATVGLLGLVGRPMDLMMMGFSALVIGVVVDDTIHFFVRFRREFERLGSYALALEETLTTVGRPITFTTMTLTLGFAVLGASSMMGIVHFGTLAGFAFVWALIADFLFAPALLLWLRPLGPERPAVSGA